MSAGEARAPRYLQLGNVLQQRIEDGLYPVGDLLPTEIELCSEFKVSRYTVREALRRLIDLGLLRRRQGSGSQVVASRVQGNYVHTMRSLSELFQYAADTVFRIHSMETRIPNLEFAGYLGEAATEPWLEVAGVRLDHEGKTPICFSIVFINHAFAAIESSLDHNEGAIYSLIERQFGVTVADVAQEIRATPMTKLAAAKLGTSSRIWAVLVVRRYLSADGKLLLMSVNHHPGDRFSYSMHLRREATKGWS